MSDIFYPFTKCLHPQRVVNTYTGEVIETGCGVCKSCTLNKSRKMSVMCSMEEQDHKYCMFVTLTYSDEFIPKALPIYDSSNNIYRIVSHCDRLGEYGKVLGVDFCCMHRSGAAFMRSLTNKTFLNGYLSYLSVREVQLFLKRFRKRLSKYSNEQIRYYACGEYGPKHFRAHYHFLLFFDEEQTLQHFSEVLSKAWPYGRVDFSLSRGKSASYVAGYVNSRCSVPQFYSSRSLRPFQLHSTFFAVGLYRSKKEEIYANGYANFVRIGRVLSGKYVQFTPWRSLATTFFPRCKGYSHKSYNQLYYTYTILRHAQQAFGSSFPFLSLTQIAENIVDMVNQRIDCVPFSSHFTPLELQSINKLIDYFLESCGKQIFISSRFDAENSQRLVSAIYSELHISRHFLSFVCRHQTTFEYHSKLKSIIAYWKLRDYENLKNFYQQQVEYSRLYPNSSFDYFYINKDNKSLCSEPIYKQFSSYVSEDFDKSIKHKVLNDLNKVFVYG